MDLFVGLPGIQGRIERYHFDLLELTVQPALPRPKTLRAFREARPEMVFSLRLPSEYFEAPAIEEEVLTRLTQAREALGARFIVASTGAQFTPTQRNREKMRSFCQAWQTESCRVAWEPRGVWGDEELFEWTEEMNCLLVRDLTREDAPEGEEVYTRLLPFGLGARVTQNSIERLAERLENYERGYVVIQSDDARKARQRLREWLGIESESEL